MTQPAITPRLLTPELTLKTLADALAFRDLRGSTACFRRDARLITAGRTTICGREQIAAVLSQLIDAETELDFSATSFITAEDLALATGPCRIRTKGPDRFWLSHDADLTAVLRLTEGDWKLAIFAPWGEPRLPFQDEC
jgi:ketosteroid isomerase-like protein